jgi:hypothetical protein
VTTSHIRAGARQLKRRIWECSIFFVHAVLQVAIGDARSCVAMDLAATTSRALELTSSESFNFSEKPRFHLAANRRCNFIDSI